MATTESNHHPTYKDQQVWQDIQLFMPEDMRLVKDEDMPLEEWWGWEGHQVHLDRNAVKKGTTSPVKVIILHGVGSNGRQMSFLVGAPLAKRGISSVAIDLPTYGITVVNPQATVMYGDWVRLVDDFVNVEAEREPKNAPIVLCGLSAGGLLAYHVAAINGKVKGIAGSCFLDQREKKVSTDTAHDSFMGNVGVPATRLLGDILGSMKIPMTVASKMYTIVNDPKALKVFLSDPTAAGNWVTVRFLKDYLTYPPDIEPEEFTTCPILLTQPGDDKWTPLELSEIFLRRLKKVHQKVVMLENAGHFPLEQPGLDQMHEALASFFKVIGKGGDVSALESIGFKIRE